MKNTDKILQAVFQDGKTREVLGFSPFGYILFKEANGKGESYKTSEQPIKKIRNH